MGRPITVGVVGCGEIAQIMHLPHLRELHGRFELAAVCDTDPGVLRSVADRFAVGKAYSDASDVFDDPDIDAVVIAAPGDHAGLIHQALQAGKDVFVEKPLCYSVDDAERIIARARAADRVVMVGYSRLFDTAFDEFLDLANAQPPGRLITATAVLPDDYFYRAHYDLARCATPAADSTTTAEPTWTYLFEEVLHNLATHELYCLRKILRSDATLRSAAPLVNRRGVHALWETADGDSVVLTLAVMTGLSGGYREEFLVAAPSAEIGLSYPSVYLRNTPAVIRHSYSDGSRGPLRTEYREGAYADPFKRELEHFADVLTAKAACRSDAVDAAIDVRTIAAIFDLCRSA